MLEGTTLGRPQTATGLPSEAEIEQRLTDALAACSGLMLVCASAQNIDRMVTLYRAAKRSGRTLLVDIYEAEVLRATGQPHIKQSSWPKLALDTPPNQRRHIKTKGLFAILDRHKGNRLYPDDLKARAADLVMLFRPAMLGDLRDLDCLADAHAVWSQWDGTLAQEPGVALRAALEAAGVPMTVIHTSGHASLADLQRLATAIAPGSIVPIHSSEGRNYPRWFNNVTACADGAWREV